MYLPIKKRKEQLALVVLDVVNAEIRLVRQDDSKNDYNTSYMVNTWRSPIDGKVVWTGPVKGEQYWKVNENIVVIGQVHLHPLEKDELRSEGVIPIPKRPYQMDDHDAADDNSFPIIQLYPLSVNQVDAVIPNSKGGSVDNLTTTEKLLKGKYDLIKFILEVNGKKPNSNPNSNSTNINTPKKKPNKN